MSCQSRPTAARVLGKFDIFFVITFFHFSICVSLYIVISCEEIAALYFIWKINDLYNVCKKETKAMRADLLAECSFLGKNSQYSMEYIKTCLTTS